MLPKDINKEKCLHTTFVQFQRVDSKSENNKDENVFADHGRSGFKEARRKKCCKHLLFNMHTMLFNKKEQKFFNKKGTKDS